MGTEDGEVYVWKMEDHTLDRKFQVHSACVKSLCYSPDGDKLATCSLDRSFKVLDLQTGMSIYAKNTDFVLKCLKWDGFMLLLGSEDGTLSIWDIVEVKLLYQHKIHDGPINALDISPDKKYVATGTEDHQVSIWKPNF